MSTLFVWAVVAVVAALLFFALHIVARKYAENQVLRDKGIPKPPVTGVPYPDIDADFFPGTTTSRDGTYQLEYLLVLNRKNRSSKNLLVFCQGRVSTIETGYHFLPFLMAAGHHVLMFNYRGVGTPGWATFETVCEDGVNAHLFGQKVVSHLLDGNWGAPSEDQSTSTLSALSRTGLLGYSLGGWIATYAAAKSFGERKQRAGVLALMDTGADMYEVLVRQAFVVRLLMPSVLLKPRMSNLAIAQMPYPETKLVAHGELDAPLYPTVDDAGNPKMGFGFPLSDGKRLWAAAPGILSRFFQLRNSSHKDMDIKDPATLQEFFTAIYIALDKQSVQ
jgi:pimeloyl-ACP methyl ester carboxylesterase